MDRFFDVLNVNSYTEGMRQRKPFKEPYRSKDYFRIGVIPACITYGPLQFLKNEFLSYFEQWKQSVDERDGFKKVQRNRMLLSQETLQGFQYVALHVLTLRACMLFI